MPNAAKSKLIKVIDDLMFEGEAVLKPVRAAGGGDLPTRENYAWTAGCQQLYTMLGKFAEPYGYLRKMPVYGGGAEAMLGTLQALRKAVNGDLLITVEDLISAELFDDLLEQADYLLSSDYFLAAGVLGRAVLEEHLRKWCDRAKCNPTKARPTLDDFKSSLYAEKHLNKLDMKHVESMAAVGNDAAHNKPELKREDVERLLRDVRDFLVKHST